MKTENTIRHKLNDLENFCKKEGYILEEIQGEIQGLKWVLGELDEDL